MSSKRPYTKPALTCGEQVALLASRGLVIPDPTEATFYLRHLNYYRLCAYWLPFEEDHGTHRFREGTTFQAVLDLYTFDRELRLLVLDALERIEVSARTQWAHQLGLRHGSHAHLDERLAFRVDRWDTNLESLRSEVDRSEEEFIRHLTATYSEELPPVWAVCEVMSLGLLSRWYSNLLPMPTRTAIASVYGIDQRVLQSWLHHLTIVRNVCAHHGRLWNREFTVKAMQPHRPPIIANAFRMNSRKLYNSLLVLLFLMDVVAPGHHWRQRLRSLLDRQERLDEMGFPKDWQSQAIWKEVAA
jgi:abortive infection bacteriophage resistance protein